MSPASSGILRWALLNRLHLFGAFLALPALRHLTSQDDRDPAQHQQLLARALVDSPHTMVRRSALAYLTSGQAWQSTDASFLVPLASACLDPDDEVSSLARTKIRTLPRKDLEDGLCDLWANSRDPRIAEHVRAAGYVGGSSGRSRVLCGLLNDRRSSPTVPFPEAVDVLLETLGDDDPGLADAAASALGDLESEPARQLFCERILSGASSRARGIAASSGYQPRDPGDRVLYHLLTEQWASLEFMDPARVLLRQEFVSCSTGRRKRALQTMQRSDRHEDLQIVLGHCADLRHQLLTRDEMEFVVGLLSENHEWRLLWRHLTLFPIDIAVHALRLLGASGWEPIDAGQSRLFAEAIDLARQIEDPGDAPFRPVTPPFTLRAELAATGRIHDVAFAPEGPLLAVATSNGVQLWDHVHNTVVSNVGADGKPIGRIAWLDTENVVYSEHSKNPLDTCRILIANVSKTAPRVLGSRQGRLTALLPLDSRRLVSTGRDGGIVFWDCDARQPSRVTRLQKPRWPRSAALSRDGHRLAVVADGVAVAEVPDVLTSKAQFRSPVAHCAVFLRDGNVLTGSHTGRVDKWFVQSNKLLRRIPEFARHRHPVVAIAVIDRHGLVVSADSRGNIQARRSETDELVAKMVAPGGRISSMDATSDGQFLAIAHSEGTVSVWDSRPLELAEAFTLPLSTFRPGLYDAVTALTNDPELEAATGRYLRLVDVLLRNRRACDVAIDDLSVAVDGTAGVGSARE